MRSKSTCCARPQSGPNISPHRYARAIDPAQARAAKGEAFRFASEKGAVESDGEPVELPNWRRGNGTVVN
jgi:hypothetical protein